MSNHCRPLPDPLPPHRDYWFPFPLRWASRGRTTNGDQLAHTWVVTCANPPCPWPRSISHCFPVFGLKIKKASVLFPSCLGNALFFFHLGACKFHPFCRTLPAPPVSPTANFHPWHPNRWQDQILGNQWAITTVSFATCTCGCRSFGHAILTYHTVPDLARTPWQTANSTIAFGPVLVESLPAEVCTRAPAPTRLPREDRRNRLRRIENYFVISPFFDLFLMQTIARTPFQSIEPYSAVMVGCFCCC